MKYFIVHRIIALRACNKSLRDGQMDSGLYQRAKSWMSMIDLDQIYPLQGNHRDVMESGKARDGECGMKTRPAYLTRMNGREICCLCDKQFRETLPMIG